MGRVLFWVAACFAGAIALPMFVLLFQPAVVYPEMRSRPLAMPGETSVPTSYTSYKSYVAPTPFLDEQLVSLAVAFVNVGDYESFNELLKKVPETEVVRLVIFVVNNQVREFAGIQQLLDDQMIDPNRKNELEASSLALVKFIETISNKDVRGRLLLEVAPFVQDSKATLRTAFEAMKQSPETWSVKTPEEDTSPEFSTEAYPMAEEFHSQAFTQSSVRDTSTQKKSTWLYWLAPLGGALGVALTFLATKMVEVPIQNIGKAVVARVLETSGLQAVADLVQDQPDSQNHDKKE